MEPIDSDSVDSRPLIGRRKKKAMAKIKKQMEFYFSDSNLAKDKFLQNLIGQNPDGYVELEVFKSFNKIKAYTTDIDIITAAVSNSKTLELSDDKTKIKRKFATIAPKDFDACTLYAEKLPPFADQKWIRDVFKHFGPVDYISIPRFKATQKIKRFAFIEFRNPESVQKACEYYQNARSKAATGNEEKTVKAEAGNVKEEELNQERKSGKRKASVDANQSPEKCENHTLKSASKDNSLKLEEISDNEKQQQQQQQKQGQSNKKRKRDSCDDQTPSKKPCSKDVASGHEKLEKAALENQLPTKENSDAMETDQNFDDDETEKSKRKRKRKKNLRDERPLLRVMSKHDWKAYRNKYLALQRLTMSKLKREIMLETQEWKELDSSSKAETSTESPKKSLQFQPGVIIKIKLSEPIESVNDIKDQVKTNAVVAYIDAPLGHTEMFLRCHSQEDAQSIIQDGKFQNLGAVELLKDTEEEDYWKKIEDERKNKLNQPFTRKKRGRDKIIAKAAKLAEQKNKHIYFDE